MLHHAHFNLSGYRYRGVLLVAPLSQAGCLGELWALFSERQAEQRRMTRACQARKPHEVRPRAKRVLTLGRLCQQGADFRHSPKAPSGA